MRDIPLLNRCHRLHGAKFDAVLERTGGFASAQELHQILRREGDGIGLTTVYRALQSLVDDKIVDLLRREDGEAIYRL